MNACSLRFYVHENQKHRGMLLYEWLFEQARQHGLPGGSAFKAMAGYGRHRVMHEQTFFELAGENTVVVEFILDDAEAATMLRIAQDDGAPLFWARFPAEYGSIGAG